MPNLNFAIEHMEEDVELTLPPWVLLEYTQMIHLAGKDSTVLFTNLSAASRGALDTSLRSNPPSDGAKFEVHADGIMTLMENRGWTLESICLLDPKAEKELSPEDGDNGLFKTFLFGGILGDDPPRDRTSELRALGFPSRHLGSVQMTTDTALGVSKRVVIDKVPLKDIPYIVRDPSHPQLPDGVKVDSRGNTPTQDFPTIVFSKKESVEMPFRYIATNDNQPILPAGMRELLREDLNKSFDF